MGHSLAPLLRLKLPYCWSRIDVGPDEFNKFGCKESIFSVSSREREESGEFSTLELDALLPAAVWRRATPRPRPPPPLKAGFRNVWLVKSGMAKFRLGLQLSGLDVPGSGGLICAVPFVLSGKPIVYEAAELPPAWVPLMDRTAAGLESPAVLGPLLALAVVGPLRHNASCSEPAIGWRA
jgi:hypothetical protein